MLHKLDDIDNLETGTFTDPFRYVPHTLVQKAAEEVIDMLTEWKNEPEGSPNHELEKSFAEGKMLGVLAVTPDKCPDRSLYYLAAFSGTVRKADGSTTSTVKGFVPPIIDLTESDCHFKIKESEISALNRKISEMEDSPRLKRLRLDAEKAKTERDLQIADMQTHICFSKMRRDEIRTETADAGILEDLIKESRFQKAELKRLKDKWKSTISEIESEILKEENEIRHLKTLRSKMSDSLQMWIFKNAEVHNAEGGSTTILDLFESHGLIPPGGTGDCAAPKLLEYAYRNGLKPLAMGEFWYGKPSQTAVRLQGHFYPSCTSKCGPLLGYMLKGLTVGPGRQTGCCESELPPHIIYSDEAIIVVEKPSGMPSVPGLDGRKSLQDWLADKFPQSQIHQVHRLDMDTSGVMVFARTEAAAAGLRAQFENRTVRKTYKARISPPCCSTEETVPLPWPQWEGPGPKEREGLFLQCCSTEKSGVVELPIMADYDERPRQKVDFKQGKPAHTEYQIISNNPDGTSDLLLHPVTGRTHQLRVHCAHALGLGRPILGDLLYGGFRTGKKGGRNADRLCLHALSISFLHPVSGTPMHFTSERATFSQEV